MAGFYKGMKVGAGLLGLGWGVYRLSQGRKDWLTSTALTAGLAATLTGMKAKRGMGAQFVRWGTCAAPAHCHAYGARGHEQGPENDERSELIAAARV